MTECNIKDCLEDGKVKISDCPNERWIYLCHSHAGKYGAGIKEGLEVDFYQYWKNMEKC